MEGNIYFTRAHKMVIDCVTLLNLQQNRINMRQKQRQKEMNLWEAWHNIF
jgi:hypothetical protein